MEFIREGSSLSCLVPEEAFLSSPLSLSLVLFRSAWRASSIGIKSEREEEREREKFRDFYVCSFVGSSRLTVAWMVRFFFFFSQARVATAVKITN